jgi:hypothetical protein
MVHPVRSGGQSLHRLESALEVSAHAMLLFGS